MFYKMVLIIKIHNIVEVRKKNDFVFIKEATGCRQNSAEFKLHLNQLHILMASIIILFNLPKVFEKSNV